MFRFLVRVVLPDRPGALGAVASRIGSVGGDLVSIEILERDPGFVVDELGVRLAGDHLLDLLRGEVLEVDGVEVECVRRVPGPFPDRSAELLAVTRALLEHPSTDTLLGSLADRVGSGLGATYVAVVDADADADAAVVASAGAVPAVDELDRLVRRVADLPVDDADDARRTATATRLTRAGVSLVVARDEPVLRQRELQWISIMAELVDLAWPGAPVS